MTIDNPVSPYFMRQVPVFVPSESNPQLIVNTRSVILCNELKEDLLTFLLTNFLEQADT